MSKLLRADFYRMYHNKRIWLCVASMIVTAIFFIIMQYSAMDYTVAFSRVIFLPMTFYGIAIAALISFFVGDDFSGGVIRNKIIAGRSRSSIYMSNLICAWSACVVVYIFTVVITVGIGINLFENNVTLADFLKYFVLGLFSVLAFGSIFGMISMLNCNRVTSVMICMGLAFGMLFLCLHTNQILVQQEYKNGVLNPHFVEGTQRLLYGMLHDMNPFGQVAQLSSMTSLNVIRWIGMDLFWMIATAGFGKTLFLRKDIR